MAIWLFLWCSGTVRGVPKRSAVFRTASCRTTQRCCGPSRGVPGYLLYHVLFIDAPGRAVILRTTPWCSWVVPLCLRPFRGVPWWFWAGPWCSVPDRFVVAQTFPSDRVVLCLTVVPHRCLLPLFRSVVTDHSSGLFFGGSAYPPVHAFQYGRNIN